MFVKSYVEQGSGKIPSVHLSDEEYGRGLQCFVPVCTDIVPINREKKLIYLAKRAAKPMAGWWWLGGRMNPSETKESSALRCLKREAGLAISSDRLQLVAFMDLLFKDRQQAPQNIGCHMADYIFAVEFTEDELLHIQGHLEAKEYKADEGLTPFSREELVMEGVFPAILDVHDAIFPGA